MLRVILSASDDAAPIGPHLRALIARKGRGTKVIVVANRCQDATADVTRFSWMASGTGCPKPSPPANRGA